MSSTTTAVGSKFDYIIYIRTTPEKLWEALIKPEFTKQYWFGTHQKSDFKKGSPWSMVIADGRIGETGEILEANPPHKLVLKWQHQLRPELKAEGCSLATIEAEAALGEAVKLSVTHEIETPNSKFIEAVAHGWPMIFSSLKTLLETGKSFVETTKMPAGF
jgi:uncharacterized protein YndB with AHSA1/START domain